MDLSAACYLRIPGILGEVGPLSHVVDLSPDDHELFLIIACEATCAYQTQVGGFSLKPAEARGLLLPIHAVPHSQAAQFCDTVFEDLFFSLKYAGRCSDGIDHSDASFLDNAMRRLAPLTLHALLVDRSRLGDSCEAWIHVQGIAHLTPDNPAQFPHGSPHLMTPIQGVLTWLNSD